MTIDLVGCEVCGETAERVEVGVMRGVDYDGADALFSLYRVTCVSGHRYNVLGDGGAGLSRGPSSIGTSEPEVKPYLEGDSLPGGQE